MTIMRRIGYDPNGLVDLLKVMEDRLKPDGLDFAKTHPWPTRRVISVQRSIGPYSRVEESAARQDRFVKALQNI